MSRSIKILFLGDVFGEPGRIAIKERLPKLIEEQSFDLVFANCENAARGRGISTRQVKELRSYGIDYMTSGNHILDVHEVFSYLNDPECPIIRPYNFPKSSPGKKTAVVESKSGVRVGLINIMGSVFMNPPVNHPFDAVDEAIADVQGDCDLIVLDMHAETTSEKRAMAWYVDGRVHLQVGTHTHVQTADEEILPKGMAFITDLGMCGPYDSVIGMDKDVVLKKFRTAIPSRFEVGLVGLDYVV